MQTGFCDSPAWQRYRELMKQRPEAFVQSSELTLVTDPQSVEAFAAETGKQLGVVYESPYHLMVVDLVRSPDGRLFAYERLLPAADGPAVVAVPMVGDRLVLLDQYRHCIRRQQYAFPRGFGEPGLSGQDNVRKEIREELGVEPEAVLPLGRITPDSGAQQGSAEAYLCRIPEPAVTPGYEEIRSSLLLTPAELEQWVREGRIDDGFTLAAYSLCLARMTENQSR